MQDNEMQAIPIDEVLTRTQVLVDYYLRLSPNKFILVAKAGSNTPVDAIARYKARNVDRLFVRIGDYHQLLGQIIRAAGVVMQSPNLSDSSKLVMIEEAMQAVYDEAQSMGFNETVFQHAKMVNHATLTFVEANPLLADMVSKLGQVSRSHIKHAMMVSIIATMIGTGHDWIKIATLEKLALGGFLHDLGKSKLPEEIIGKDIERMSHDEKIIYQSHPEIGRQMLATVKTVPDDVSLIVYEHHELADGSGFPRGLKDFQISPLARVVALANAYTDTLAVAAKKGVTPQTAVHALEMLEFHRTQQFNKDAMRALRRLLTGEPIQAVG